ncbi:MFS transporter [Amycolatopsis nigrescens]|uniref:MFS transporter n=1 Tax=Amycolatopsis nigrescens TaxID=381445 RepID=UPI0003A238BB|nr:MFS transporter [Amycolatopsis nigrescens]
MHKDSLWRHQDFRRLWAGDTASQTGAFVGHTVLPLLAATVLAASPLEMGLLGAAEHAAFLVLGLPAGVWVDRMRRKRLMLRADLLRAAMLFSVPVAWWLGVLTLAQLVVVALLVSAGTLFFDVAYQSYLPTLVRRDQLIAGNARLQASQSVAQVVGPGAGGALTQLAGAANAVLVTGTGYLASALCLWRIRAPDPEPAPRRAGGMVADIREGLRFVFGTPALRAITITTAVANLTNGMVTAVQILFFTRELGLSPAGVGTVLSIGGGGGVLGALTGGMLARRIGQARAIWVVPLLTWPAQLLVPLAAPGWRVGLAALGLAVFGYGVVVYNIAQVSFRQSICPDRLLGRMNASVRFVVWGVLPLGSLAGGALGELAGLRGTLWLSGAGIAAGAAALLLSPLRGMRDLPVTSSEPSRPPAEAEKGT